MIFFLSYIYEKVAIICILFCENANAILYRAKRFICPSIPYKDITFFSSTNFMWFEIIEICGTVTLKRADGHEEESKRS